MNHFRLLRPRSVAPEDGARWNALALSMLTLLGLATTGCTAAPPSTAPTAPAQDTTRVAPEEPRRSGSLRQSEISVRLRAGTVLVEVTPLVDWVLEAVAPDTQRRLARIVEAQGPELERQTGRAQLTLILVSFSAGAGPQEFHPDDLHLVARGLRERPLAIQAITPGWGSQRLAQQSTATAVYAYGSELDLTREMTVEYGGFSNASWSQRIPIIEAERGRNSNPFSPLGQIS